jgi:hypothetical protein
LGGLSARRKASTCTETQKNAHTLILNIHVLSGIRTHDHGFRASEDSTWLEHLHLMKCYYSLSRFHGVMLCCSVSTIVGRCASKFLLIVPGKVDGGEMEKREESWGGGGWNGY